MTLHRKTPLGRGKKPLTPKGAKPLERLLGEGLVFRASAFKAKAKPMKKRRNLSGEKALFQRLWDERPHRCEVCHDPIQEAMAGNFSHLLPKNAYPDYRLDERNVIIMDMKCHNLWHQKYDKLHDVPNWAWVVNIYLALKKEAYRASNL